MFIKRAQLSDLKSISVLSEQWEAEEITYGLKANVVDDLLDYLGTESWVIAEDKHIVGNR